ncbi:hypothetical protein ACXYMX_00200 [Sporosarcina sp. CAU 1771]
MSRSSKTDSELSDGLTAGGHHQLMFIILAVLKNVDEAIFPRLPFHWTWSVQILYQLYKELFNITEKMLFIPIKLDGILVSSLYY